MEDTKNVVPFYLIHLEAAVAAALVAPSLFRRPSVASQEGLQVWREREELA